MPRLRLLVLLALLPLAPLGCEREDAAPGLGDPPALAGETAPLAPDLDLAERERLRALGYAEVGAPLAPGAPTGVLHFDPERASPGLNLLTHSHFCTTQLVDMSGNVRHSWSVEPCGRWANAVLAPNGDLVVAGRVPHAANDAEAELASRYLLRLAWDGSPRWRIALPVHHDVEVLPDGRVVSLTYGFRVVPEVHPEVPTREDAIVVVSAAGEVETQVSFWDLLRGAPDVFQLHPVEPRSYSGAQEVDLFHSNSLEWLRGEARIGGAASGLRNGVLVCLRSQDSVVLIDWDSRLPVWAWGKGVLSAPHDATLLASGNVLVFDNGHGRGWSRVVEVDPRTNRIVWEYRDPEPGAFYTETRGAAQRLANGNTLVTESGAGRAFEVAADGDLVWEYRSPMLTSRRKPSVIVRARRFEGWSWRRLLAAVERGEELPWVD